MATNANVVVRRVATSLFLAALLVFAWGVWVGLVYFENTLDLGAAFISSLDLDVWVLILGIILAVIFVAVTILYFLPIRQTAAEYEDEFSTDWESSQSHEPFADPDATVREPIAAATPVEPMFDDEPLMAEADALLVQCTSCQHEFELPYTEERPIVAMCPQCGQEAILGEDLIEEAKEKAATKYVGDPPVPVIDIEGIGPEYAERLQEVGVYDTEELRQANPIELAQKTDINETLIRTWQSMADLYRVSGIGKQFSEVLVRAGVPNVDSLASETPSHLEAKVDSYLDSLDQRPLKTGVDRKRAKRFIDSARRLQKAEEKANASR